MLDKENVPMICQILGIIFHAILCYILVWKLDMAVEGVGIASSVSNLAIYISLLTYSKYIPEIQEAI